MVGEINQDEPTEKEQHAVRPLTPTGRARRLQPGREGFIMYMTFNEALLIQRAQMAYYRNSIGRKGCKKIIADTIYPIDIEPDKSMFIGDINGLVPRGGSFESLIFYRPKEYDTTKAAWHDAIRKGLI